MTWFCLFTYGEGTFFIPNLAPYFQIAQNSKNKAILDIINTYLGSIPKGISTTKSTALPLLTPWLLPRVSVCCFLSKKTAGCSAKQRSSEAEPSLFISLTSGLRTTASAP